MDRRCCRLCRSSQSDRSVQASSGELPAAATRVSSPRDRPRLYPVLSHEQRQRRRQQQQPAGRPAPVISEV